MNIDNKKEKAWWADGLMLFARLSSWIAIPVILGAFLGKYLDDKYDSEPWLFLLLVGLSFIVSMIGLVRNTLKEYKKIEGESTNNKKKS